MIGDGYTPQIIRELIPGMYLGEPNVALNSAKIKSLQAGASPTVEASVG